MFGWYYVWDFCFVKYIVTVRFFIVYQRPFYIKRALSLTGYRLPFCFTYIFIHCRVWIIIHFKTFFLAGICEYEQNIALELPFDNRFQCLKNICIAWFSWIKSKNWRPFGNIFLKFSENESLSIDTSLVKGSLLTSWRCWIILSHFYF